MMQEYVNVLGDIVRQERLKADITQDELAERIGIDSRTILKIENYRGNPKMEVLYPLVRTLNIDANRIFYPESYRDSAELKQFHAFLSQCTAEELHSLYHVCQAVLSVLKDKHPIEIVQK